MKTLKLDHSLANLVRTGKKTSTWRLYDDKDISVDDTLEFIDKVDPKDRTSWRPIGVGRVDRVLERRLGDISPEDAAGGEQFASAEEMLETYRRYYGPQVTLDTPVKIIHFNFTPSKNKVANVEDENTTKITEVKLFADGGSRGNPGPSASGYVVLDMDDNVITKQGIYLGVTTNNQAEYQALKFALEEAQKLGAQTLHVYMDSLLVVNQMLGIFKVKNRDLWPIHDAVKKLAAQFKRVTYTQVPREFNKAADSMVNDALDAAAETGQNDHS
ncbi:MAG TPA: reverse transcriptase-like protein [Candidatus Saccharimonadales bacterium]|nr:reverse transcriptase-like protein [Candidatus Saccharimonadales bacterium]